MMNKSVKLFIGAALFLCLIAAAGAAASKVVTFPTKEVLGKGPLPYNYRIIDSHIHVGGHPLNPATDFNNSEKEVVRILRYLRSKEVKTVVDLENTGWIQKRYQSLLEGSGINRVHVPLNAFKMPTEEEWERIKAAMKNPVYLHCKWGADRTGAVIGRYLVEEKGYAPSEAYYSVITGGSHAGPLGGLKKGWLFRNLKQFIWQKSW